MAQVESDKLNALLKPIQDELRLTLQAYNTATRNKQDSLAQTLMTKLTKLSRKTTAMSGEFAKSNPTSRLALNALELYSKIDLSKNIGDIEAIYRKLLRSYKNAYTGKLIEERIRNENKTRIGKRMTSIEVTDSTGKKVYLPSFKSSYVLIDFWASWCEPCRQENPNLIKVFRKYGSKRFSIVSISIDKFSDKAKWLEAVRKDGLLWTQLIEGASAKKSMSTILGIQSIPFNLLLNKEGIIVAKNLRGNELEETLANYLR